VTSTSVVASALGTVATDLVRHGPTGWRCTTGNGRRLPVHAVLEDGWLALTAPCDGQRDPLASAAGAWNLLHANASFGGDAHVALGAGDRPIVRAHVWIDPDLVLADRIAAALDGLAGVAARLEKPPGAPPSMPEGDGGQALLDAFEASCPETGWCVRRREDGAIAVDLAVPGACHQAALAPRGGAVTAAVSLVEDETVAAPLAETVRHALALLLLRASGALRMVRAAATEDAPRFEVACATPSSAAEISHALAALSVACRLAGAEAAVLRHDADVATTYVRTRNQQKEEQ
jgi:hypothetical protein